MTPVALVAQPLVVATRHKLKDDKTTNKALKFLQEVLQSIGNGQVAGGPFNEAVQVLLAAPKEQGRKVEGLYSTLMEKATVEQRATLRSSLQEGEKHHLLSLN